ncbi:MAG TPA: tetratricopeptide repeat protein [Thermodesulfovibrionia bacterium]|nr:tetratricopeptide repeat protein [Thermodesulfovibrionia bacterium]
MPKPIKKRIDTRQHILDEDQVKNVYQQAFDYYKANKNTVIASAVVIVVVLAAALIYSLFSGSKEANFRQEEATAYQLIYDMPSPGKASVSEKERLTKAVEHYKKAIELKEDRVTLLSLGHAYFRLSEFDKAIETYDAFIKQYNDSKLIPVAWQMTARAYEQKGDKEKTLKSLNALASYKNGLFKDTVFFKEAQLLEADGKKEDAIKKYEEIISTYPDSLLVGQAKAKVATFLGGSGASTATSTSDIGYDIKT